MTEKNLQFTKKICNFQHLPRLCFIHEAPWIQIFVFLQPRCDVKNEVVFLLQEHSSLRGVKQKKREKKHENLAFKLLL